MNNLTHRCGGLAAVGFLSLFSTSPVFAQESPSETRRTQDPSVTAQTQDPQGMSQIAAAYRQLHDSTLNALEAQSKTFSNSATKPGSNSDSSPSSSATMGTSASLRGDRLLIAACTKGLLAGAPVGNGAMPKPAGETDTTGQSEPEGSRRGNREGRASGSGSTPDGAGATGSSGSSGIAGSGQTVGMLLVSSLEGAATGRHNRGSTGDTDQEARQNRGERPRDGSTGRTDRDTADASSGTARGGVLAPGAYAIKRDGNSVWLTDASGQVALRTSIDMPTTPTATAPNDAGSSSRNTPTAGAAMSDSRDWELVFGAITKEAMTSMGWAPHGSGMQRR